MVVDKCKNMRFTRAKPTNAQRDAHPTLLEDTFFVVVLQIINVSF